MQTHNFILMLGQDSFFPSVKVIMPYQAIVIYNIINDEVNIIDITFPFCILEWINLSAIRKQAIEAAENNAVSLDLIGQNLIITTYEILNTKS
jgi:hypothetical protein